MNSDKYANTNFVLTGWADNYTGTEAINARLRAKRAEGVKDLLVRSGVDASRLCC
jgi:outer membrane protein OmpA-like peptidoglycan-associated protein